MKKKGGQIREKQTRRKFIRKGHSSDDNPEQKKFRLAAQTTFFTKNTGPSNLTTDALLKHDAQDSGNTKGSDAQSEGGLTFQSWSSHWTDCTNKTFGSVSGLWNSQSALHKEILAVLAAVTETIQESEGGKESETAYFAALMTTLESMEDVTSAAAVAYLLSLAIKRVPEPVLKSRFSTASKIVTDSLNKFIEQGSTTLIKSLIKVLSYLLRVQDQATWADSSTLLCYDLLLAMTVYKHPKVRNNAHQGVCAVMKGSSLMKLPNKPMYHPAAKSTAEYCISKLNTRTIDSNKVVDKEKHYILTVLRSVMQCFSAPFIKTSVESILQIMAPGDNVLNATAMSTLHAFFQSSVPEKSLPAKMNAKIITALYDFQPSENDVQPSLAWITVMEANHLHLHKLDEQLCRSHIKRLISTCMKILQSDRKQICTCSENTIKKILAECVKPSMKNVKKGGENVPSSNSIKQYLQEIFQMVEAGLGYQYHKNWDNVLRLLAHCYMIFGKEHSCFMIKSLVSLVNMRDDHFAYTEQSNEAYGAAVRYWGPKCVLEAVPLDIKVDDHDYSRSWMLPVLTEYVRNTELAFFISYFMPLAAMYKTKEEVCAEANDDTNERVYRVLHLQVWRLLPSFCTSTTDIPQSFKNIAKTMGMMIQDNKVLRTAVMSALRKLVDHSVHKDDARASMMNFSKNFIPLLLNLYNDDAAEEHRVPIATTIKTYLQVASPELVKTLFSKCYGKLADDSTPVDQRPPLLDVMKLLVGALDQDDLVTILEYAIDNMTTDNIRVQKKTYRILEYVMFLKSKKAQSVVQEHFDTIKTNLISSVSKAKAPSKAARLICLKHIIQLTDQPNKEFLNDIIPEVIMCTKEIAARSRNAAYILLVEIGEAMIKWSDTREEAITEYLTLLMAGFGGGPTLVTATIHAVNRVVHEFKADISCDMVEQLFDSCCLLMQSKIKQISTAALSFVKVLLVAFDIEVGRQHLRNVVDSLIIMKMKHHPRFIIKELFTRLVRKYSVECIRPLVPENEHIMINSVVKALNLQKKKKTKQHLLAKYGSETPRENTEKKKTETFDEMLEDTDSEPEDDDKKSRMKNRKIAISKRKKQEFGSYLKEDGEDGNIIDFLDPEASKQVSATRPVQKANKRGADSNRGFKTSSDGRLVITETEDEKQFSKKRRAQDDDDDDLDELLDAMNHYKKRPKIKFGCEDLDKADYKSSYAESYRTGGTGIHRPLNKKQKTGGGAQASKTLTGEAYKSTKAGGDVKRKNMPDPYAYVPLRNQILNKRKQAKLKGQFKGLVKGAKKGAKAGKDMRAKRK